MENLQKYAELFNSSQVELARRFNISQPYMSLLFNGQKVPSLKLAVRIERMTGGYVPASGWVSDDE